MTLLCNRSYTTSGMPARTVHDCALNDSLLASIICMRMDIAKPCLLQHVGVSRPALEGNPRAIARSTVIDCRNFSLLHLCVIHRRVCCTCVWFTGVSVRLCVIRRRACCDCVWFTGVSVALVCDSQACLFACVWFTGVSVCLCVIHRRVCLLVCDSQACLFACVWFTGVSVALVCDSQACLFACMWFAGASVALVCDSQACLFACMWFAGVSVALVCDSQACLFACVWFTGVSVALVCDSQECLSWYWEGETSMEPWKRWGGRGKGLRYWLVLGSSVSKKHFSPVGLREVAKGRPRSIKTRIILFCLHRAMHRAL